MIRTVLFVIYAAFVLIVLLIPALIAAVLRGSDPCRPASGLISWAARVFLPAAFFITGMEFEIEGKENIPEGAALFAGNHQGDFDGAFPLFAFGPIPSIVAKIQIKKIPIANMMMDKLMGCIFIDRDNARESLKCISNAQTILENGRSVLIFPEGTRSKGPDMGEFKHGAFRCAMRAGVPVVPFAVDGTWKLFEEKHRIVPGKVKLTILPPVDCTEFNKTAELSDHVQDLIRQQLDRNRALPAENNGL